MDTKRIGKEKKIMGELIQFPQNRVVRAPKPQPKLSEKEMKEREIVKFVERLTEQLSMDVLAVFQDNVVHMKSEKFLKDLAVLVECIKSLLYRDFGMKHPMQDVTDILGNIVTLKNGQRLTDLNYSRLSANLPQNRYLSDIEQKGIKLAEEAGVKKEYQDIIGKLRDYVKNNKKEVKEKEEKPTVKIADEEQIEPEAVIEFEPKMDLDN